MIWEYEVVWCDIVDFEKSATKTMLDEAKRTHTNLVVSVGDGELVESESIFRLQSIANGNRFGVYFVDMKHKNTI